MLGSRVRTHPNRTEQARGGSGIYYRAATLLEHLLDLVFHAEPDTFQIYRQGAVPVLLGVVGDVHHGPRDSGVVMRTIEATPSFYRGRYQRFDFGGPRYVGLEELRFGSGSPDQTGG